jgi:hypothetical protein
MNRVFFPPMPFLAVCALAVMAGCSAGDGKLGGSAGTQPAGAPVAMASIINYAGPDVSGNTTANVRSQAEVIVSGKDSDDPDGPILQYSWEVADAGGTGLATADLLVRDRASVNLTMPRVSAAATVRLRLTVTASDGAKDSADAILNVLPAADGDGFLQYPGSAATFGIVVTTSSSRSAASANATYRLKVERRVKYRPRAMSGSGAVLSNYCALPQSSWPPAAWTDGNQPWLPEPGFDGSTEAGQYIVGQWNQGAGTVGVQPSVIAAIAAAQNPRYFLPIPSLDADDVNRHYRSVVSPDPDRQLKGSDIDDSLLEVRITLEPTAGAVDAAFVLINEAGEAIGNPVSNNGTGAAVTMVVDAETLRRGASQESRLTAQAYYCAIDPNGRRLTFADWLVTNGFNPAAAEFGADPVDAPAARPHAIYVNNYDLGFGRDMYMKRTPTGCTGASEVKQNVAGVVVNYPSLEAAVRHNGSFIAVAMEYALRDPAGSACDPANRMTTFYAYVPDDDGDADNNGTVEAGQGLPAYRRVLSANFDGRGEKYIPGSCAVCHGGVPRRVMGAGGAYPNGGDIQATFLPWDLDALLYTKDAGSPSRADPSFSRASEDDGLRSKYSRDAQAATLREFNRIAYSTYPNPATQNVGGKYPFAHYAGPRQLIEGWYGADLSGTYNGAFVPAEWPATDASGLSPRDIYRNVLAQNCRACHLQQVQTATVLPDAVATRAPQFSRWADFVSYATPATGETQGKLQQHVFATAVMPGSRLTSDRFWLPSSNSPGDQLATALRTLSSLPATPLRPGTPGVSSRQVAGDIGIEAGSSCSAGSRADELTCPLLKWISVNAAPVSFVRQDLRWALRRVQSGSECSAPELTPAGAVTAADATSRFAFRATTPGLFCVTAAAGSISLKTWRIVIADRWPVLRNPATIGVAVGTPVVLAATTTASAGTTPLLSSLGDGIDSEHRITEIQGVARACPFSTPIVNAPVTVGTLGCVVESGIDKLTFTPSFTQARNVTFSVGVADVNGSRAQPFGFVNGVGTPSATATLVVSIDYQAALQASARTYTVGVYTGTGAAATPIDIFADLGLTGSAASWRIRITAPAARTPSGPAYTDPGLSGAGTLSGPLNDLQASVSYTRPTRTATLLAPDNKARATPDHVGFSFTMVRVNGSTVIEEIPGFTGTIRILSTKSLAVPKGVFTARGCTGCHTAASPSGPLSLTGSNVHSQLFNGGTSTLCAGALIDVANPDNSCLFSSGLRTNHTNNNRAVLTDPGDITTIKEWINEGAMELE